MTQINATAPRRRNRHLLRWLVAAVVLVLLLVAADAGAAWHFSGVVLHHDAEPFDEVVKAVDKGKVTLALSDDTRRRTAVGLDWPGGHAILDDSVQVDGDAVVRHVVRVTQGSLTAGLHVAMSQYVFAGDPKSARSLDFRAVDLSSDLGRLPAWFVPPATPASQSDAGGDGPKSWVIAVHGRGGTREEALRVLPAIGRTGAATLVVSYRNDKGAPQSPDGYDHLGATEYRDVDAAIDYARSHGAERIILYGWSMGGAIVLLAARNLGTEDASLIKGIVLDSPVLDWSKTLDLQGRRRNLPAPLTYTAKQVVQWRDDVDLDTLDQVAYVPDLGDIPVLLYLDLADTTVPTGPAFTFMQRRNAEHEDAVTLVSTAGGEHTGSWNVNPAEYERTLGIFLRAYG